MYPLLSIRLGGVGPQRMRQQLENTDPVEKGFFGPVFVADLLDEKEPLISSFVV